MHKIYIKGSFIGKIRTLFLIGHVKSAMYLYKLKSKVLSIKQAEDSHNNCIHSHIK